MIKITDGSQIIVVTNGAYDSIYKRMGFRPVEQVQEAEEIAKAASKAMEEHGVPYVGEEQGSELTGLLSGLVNKPVDEWTKEECAAYVKEHNIDLGGARKESAIKAAIQNWIDRQDDNE